MNKKVKWSCFVLLGLILITTVMVKSIDLNKYKGHLNKFVEGYGLKLDIQGNIKLSLFPNLGIYIDSPTKLYVLSDLKKQVLEVGQIKFDLQLLPLLSKKLNLENLYLNNARLDVDTKFLKAIESIKNKNLHPEKAILDAEKGVKERNFEFVLNLIEIKNGNLSYKVDETNIEFEKVSIKSKAGEALNINGIFKNKNKNNLSAEFKATVNELEKLIEGKGTGFSLWAGFDSVELKGEGIVENDEKSLSISKFKLTLDDNELDGNLKYNKPSNLIEVNGKLNLQSLVLPNDFAFILEGDSSNLQHNNNQDKQEGVWSTEEFDLSFLSNLILNVDLIGKDVQLYGVNIDKLRGSINIKNSNATILIDEGIVAQGAVKARVNIAAKNRYYKANLYLKDGQLDVLSKDLFGHSNVGGKIGIGVDLETSGKTISSLVKNLQGKGFFSAVEGKVYEIKFIPTNILNLDNLKFDKVSGSFTIKNGIISNQDFTLSSPIALLTGYGYINLPDYAINCLINPDKLYDNKVAEKGLAVEIKGDLRDPRISLNADKFIKKTIKGAVKKVFKEDDFLDKALGGILDSIF